jgi:hypothetical protein
VEDDNGDLPESPGDIAAAAGVSPDLVPTQAPLLSADFQPSLDNLIPNTMEEDNGDSGAVLGALEGDATGTSDAFSASPGTSLLGTLEGLGTSAFQAFVTNPQNAQTAEQQQLQSAQVTSALSSQYFGYILIALVIWLIFSAVEKK